MIKNFVLDKINCIILLSLSLGFNSLKNNKKVCRGVIVSTLC